MKDIIMCCYQQSITRSTMLDYPVISSSLFGCQWTCTHTCIQYNNNDNMCNNKYRAVVKQDFAKTCLTVPILHIYIIFLEMNVCFKQIYCCHNHIELNYHDASTTLPSTAEVISPTLPQPSTAKVISAT